MNKRIIIRALIVIGIISIAFVKGYAFCHAESDGDVTGSDYILTSDFVLENGVYKSQTSTFYNSGKTVQSDEPVFQVKNASEITSARLKDAIIASGIGETLWRNGVNKNNGNGLVTDFYVCDRFVYKNYPAPAGWYSYEAELNREEISEWISKAIQQVSLSVREYKDIEKM